MTPLDGDDDLRRRLAALREHHGAAAPPFERTLALARTRELAATAGERAQTPAAGGGGRPATRGWLAAAAAAAAVLALVLALPRSVPRPLPPPDPSLSAWVAPTDFLLTTPAAELWTSIPAIPGALPTLAQPPNGDTPPHD